MKVRGFGLAGTMIAALAVAGLAGPPVAAAQPQVMPTATTTKGDLKITLTGLPAGVRANLTVTRAGYVARPTRAITLANLVPAVYTVTATPSLVGGKAYVPTPASARVGVVARGVRTVAITYRAVTAPGVPTGVSALSVGDGAKANVAWLPPTLTGGQVLGYTAVAAPGGRSCTTTGAATCTIAGLARGVRYTVSLRTRNAAGTSAAAFATIVTKSCLTVAARANLSGCSLAGAKLAGRNLSGANLTRANLTRANLAGANLTRATLTRATLTRANLTNADLPWADLTGTNLTGAKMTNAYLYEANLAGANLADTNLTAATLTGANLDDTNLTGATLTGVRSGGVMGTPRSLREDTFLRDGYLIGPGMDLSDADLPWADLTGTNLAGANLTGADLWRANLADATLTGANLTWAILTGANLTGADLTGANLTGADLYGADLTDANLPRADLTGATLIGATLAGADLTDANLTNANLSGAILSGAVLEGANLSGTLWSDGHECAPESIGECL